MTKLALLQGIVCNSHHNTPDGKMARRIAPVKVKSIFSEIPEHLSDEIFEIIAEGGAVKVERIISESHSSPEGYWYDQDHDEWVIVLRGSAGILFEGAREPVVMKPGDWINIPAHVKHRVEWTDSNEKTIWVAVHYGKSTCRDTLSIDG